MKEKLRHRLNPLHVYCRLREAGLARCKARRFCVLYERIYSLFL